MKLRIFIALISILIIAVTTLCIAPIDLGIVPNLDRPEWFNLSHGAYNFFLSWRIDPITLLFGKLVYAAAPIWTASLVWIQLSILGIGSQLLIEQLAASKNSKQKFFEQVFGSLVIPLFIAAVWGRDTILISAVCWIPWLIMAMYAAIRRPILGTPLVAIAALLHACAANQIAWAGVIAAYLFVNRTAASSATTQGNRPLNFMHLTFLLMLTPAVVAIINAPVPLFPSYPPEARVVPDDGLLGIVRPLIGPDFPIPVIDRLTIRSDYSWFSLIGLAVLLFSWPAVRNSRLRSLYFIPSVLIGLVFLDTCVPEAFALISPIATVGRIVPGTFLLSLTPWAMCVSVYVILLSWCIAGRQMRFIVLGLLVIAFFINSQNLYKKDIIPLAEMKSDLSLLRDVVESDPAQQTSTSFLISPSLGVIKGIFKDQKWSDQILPRTRLISTATAVSAGEHHPRISSYPSANSAGRLSRMVDEKIRTRWSSGTGKQSGTEALLISIPAGIKLDAIELDPGAFQSDFPRGLRVFSSPQCTFLYNFQPSELEPYMDKAVEISEWQGAIKFSSDGFPYFASQSDVRVTFSETREVECLLIEQTGHDEHFDWSVAELRFVRSPL